MPFDLKDRPVVVPGLEFKAAGVTIDTLGRHWSSAKHPRDSRGRFIETGGIARVWGGGLGKVLRSMFGGKIEMQMADGSHRIVPARQITMVRRPNGEKPTANKAKVVAEDAARDANKARPNTADTHLVPDEHPDAPDLTVDPEDEHLDNPWDGAPSDDDDPWEPSREDARRGDWMIVHAETPSGEDVYALAEVVGAEKGKATRVRFAGDTAPRPLDKLKGSRDRDVVIPREDIGDPKSLESRGVNPRGKVGALRTDQLEKAIDGVVEHRSAQRRDGQEIPRAPRAAAATTTSEGRKPADITPGDDITSEDLSVTRGSKDGSISLRVGGKRESDGSVSGGTERGHVGFVNEASPDKWQVRDAEGKPVGPPKASWENAVTFLASHLSKNGTPNHYGDEKPKPAAAKRAEAPAAPVAPAPEAEHVPTPEVAPAAPEQPSLLDTPEAPAPAPEAHKPGTGNDTQDLTDEQFYALTPQEQDAWAARRKTERDAAHAAAEQAAADTRAREEREAISEHHRSQQAKQAARAEKVRKHREKATRPSTTPAAPHTGAESTTEGADREHVPAEDSPVLEHVPAVAGGEPARPGELLREPGQAGQRSGDRNGRPAGAGAAPDELVRDEAGAPSAGDPNSRGNGAAGNGVPAAGAGDRAPRDVAPQQFQPGSQEDLAGRGFKTKLRGNMDALRTLQQIKAEGRTTATPEEQRKLARWAGWGALAQVFDESNPEFAKEREELRGLIPADEWNMARQNTLNAHYTDLDYVKATWEGLQDLGFDGGKVLEPGSGSGNFIGTAPDGTRMTGVELEPTTARISQLLYPKSRIDNIGFEDFNAPNDSFDAVAGNVPFGNYAVYDKTHNPDEHSIHNHFILKSLALTKPGGLVALHTSRYTMDGESSKARKARAQMFEKADLVGAVRMPAGAHSATAGTDVVTDLLIFRKRKAGEEPGDRSWVDTGELTGDAGKVPVNSYFLNNPDNVLGDLTVTEGGRYSAEPELTVKGDKEHAGEHLRNALSAITDDAQERGLTFDPSDAPAAPGTTPKPKATVVTPAPDAPQAPAKKKAAAKVEHELHGLPDIAKEGSIGEGTEVYERTITHGANGKPLAKPRVERTTFMQTLGGDHEPYFVPKTQEDELRHLIGLRKALEDLKDAEASTRGDSPEVKKRRHALNAKYDAYAEKYGAINRFDYAKEKDAPEKPELTEDGDAEDVTEEKPPRRILPPQAGVRDNPAFAGVFALDGDYDPAAGTGQKADIFEKRTISNRVIATHADNAPDALTLVQEQTGKVDLPAIARMLGTDEKSARAQLGDLVFEDPEQGGRLVSKAEYLSADNIYDKLDAAREAAAKDPKKYAGHVKALEGVMPEAKTPANIMVTLGAPWIDAEHVERFAQEMMGHRSISIENPGGSLWTVRGTGRKDVRATQVWGTQRKPFHSLLESMLKQAEIKVYDDVESPDGGTKKVLNPDATLLAQDKAEEIADRFSSWLWEDPDRAAKLLHEYNYRHNSVVGRSYDGSPKRTFPGMSPTWQENLYPHQNDGAARIVSEPAAMLAHVVGAGKTNTMIAGAMELRRLDLAKKPAIVVPNHMLAQWQREFLDLYPQAKILAVDSSTLGSPAKRRVFLQRVANGDWDSIVMTQESFKSMPMKPENERKYLNQELDTLRAWLESAKKVDGKSQSVKQIEKRIKNAEIRIKKLMDAKKDEGALNFEDTGIDYLMVDEAHHYKNLRIPSADQSLAKVGSQKATDLDMKLWHLRNTNESGRIVTFATGTPIANSISESYVMQKFLRPDLLEKAGIEDFDSWVASFAEKQTVVEMTVAGKFRQRTRFAKFRNLSGLLRMWMVPTDTKLAEDLTYLKRPLLKADAEGDRKPDIEAIPASDMQQAYLQWLGERAERVSSGQVTPEEDNMLKISSDGRKAAFDMRLVNDPEFEEMYGERTRDNTDSKKITQAADRIFSRYDKTKDRRFKIKGTDREHPTPGALQIVFADLGTPKDNKPGQPQTFSTYDELKKQLVARGIPANKVRFIHEAGSAQEKADLFEACRNGQVAVLVGSTEKMGVGTNIQDRAIALDHLDVPWRPADLEQREGRVIRAGNQNKEVEVSRYVTEGTFDAFMWGAVERKAGFIQQMMRGDVTQDEIEDVGDVAADAALVKSIASGNPLLVDQAFISGELRKLRKLANQHKTNTDFLKRTIRDSDGRVRFMEELKARYRAAIAKRVDVTPENYNLSVGLYNRQRTFATRDDAVDGLGERLQDMLDVWMPAGEGADMEAGSFGGLTLMYRTRNVQGSAKQIVLSLSEGDGYRAKPLPNTDVLVGEKGASTKEGIRGILTQLENRLGGFEKSIETTDTRIKHQNKEKADAQSQVDRAFARADELQLLEERSKNLDTVLENWDSSDEVNALKRERAKGEYDRATREHNTLIAKKNPKPAPVDKAAVKQAQDDLAHGETPTEVDGIPVTVDAITDDGDEPDAELPVLDGDTPDETDVQEVTVSPEEIAKDRTELGLPEAPESTDVAEEEPAALPPAISALPQRAQDLYRSELADYIKRGPQHDKGPWQRALAGQSLSTEDLTRIAAGFEGSYFAQKRTNPDAEDTGHLGAIWNALRAEKGPRQAHTPEPTAVVPSKQDGLDFTDTHHDEDQTIHEAAAEAEAEAPAPVDKVARRAEMLADYQNGMDLRALADKYGGSMVQAQTQIQLATRDKIGTLANSEAAVPIRNLEPGDTIVFGEHNNTRATVVETDIQPAHLQSHITVEVNGERHRFPVSLESHVARIEKADSPERERQSPRKEATDALAPAEHSWLITRMNELAGGDDENAAKARAFLDHEIMPSSDLYDLRDHFADAADREDAAGNPNRARTNRRVSKAIGNEAARAEAYEPRPDASEIEHAAPEVLPESEDADLADRIDSAETPEQLASLEKQVADEGRSAVRRSKLYDQIDHAKEQLRQRDRTTGGDDSTPEAPSAPEAPAAETPTEVAPDVDPVTVKGTPEYQSAYKRGWASGSKPGGLEAADSRNEPNAWYDGYQDRAAGRPKWTLMHHDNVEAYEAAAEKGPEPVAEEQDTPQVQQAEATDAERAKQAADDAYAAAKEEGASNAAAKRAAAVAEADELTTSAGTDAERPIPHAPETPEHAAVVDALENPKTPTQLPSEKFPLTGQQQAVADAVVADGKDVKVEAKAGAGKTSTLEAIARRFEALKPNAKIIYIAFNKSVQTEAEGRMPGNVEARTGHSIAWAWAGKSLTDKKDRGGMLRRSDEIASHLGIRGDLVVEGGAQIEPSMQAQLVMRAVDKFAYSADDEVGYQHFGESLHGLSDRDKVRMLGYAKKAWKDITEKDGKLAISFDHLRKMWALSKPDLSKSGSGLRRPANVLFLDEAQDTPPVLAKVVADQKMQKVIVGDADQAIYGFTGATDYLSTAEADVALPLTKSWRFGPEVADAGNRFLQVLGSKDRVEGGGPASTITRDMTSPDAILVRSNGGMIGEIVAEQENGRTVGVPKGTKQDLLSLVETARYLKGEGRAPNRMHEDLAPFRTWQEFKDAADKGDDAKITMLNRIIDQFGLDGLERIIGDVIELDDQGGDALAGITTTVDGDTLSLSGKTWNLNQKLKAAGQSFGQAGFRWNGDKKLWQVTGDQAKRDAAMERLRTMAAGHTDATEKPDVVVSTAHKAKGLEWGRVKIGEDFKGPKVNPETDELVMPSPEELKLAYVAVTRAEKELDPGSLSWVYDYTDANGGTPGDKPHEPKVEVPAEKIAGDRADLGLPETPATAPAAAPEAAPAAVRTAGDLVKGDQFSTNGNNYTVTGDPEEVDDERVGVPVRLEGADRDQMYTFKKDKTLDAWVERPLFKPVGVAGDLTVGDRFSNENGHTFTVTGEQPTPAEDRRVLMIQPDGEDRSLATEMRNDAPVAAPNNQEEPAAAPAADAPAIPDAFELPAEDREPESWETRARQVHDGDMLIVQDPNTGRMFRGTNLGSKWNDKDGTKRFTLLDRATGERHEVTVPLDTPVLSYEQPSPGTVHFLPERIGGTAQHHLDYSERDFTRSIDAMEHDPFGADPDRLEQMRGWLANIKAEKARRAALNDEERNQDEATSDNTEPAGTETDPNDPRLDDNDPLIADDEHLPEAAREYRRNERRRRRRRRNWLNNLGNNNDNNNGGMGGPGGLLGLVPDLFELPLNGAGGGAGGGAENGAGDTAAHAAEAGAHTFERVSPEIAQRATTYLNRAKSQGLKVEVSENDDYNNVPRADMLFTDRNGGWLQVFVGQGANGKGTRVWAQHAHTPGENPRKVPAREIAARIAEMHGQPAQVDTTPEANAPEVNAPEASTPEVSTPEANVAASTGGTAAQAGDGIRDGEMGMQITPGEVVRTVSGRETTPFPTPTGALDTDRKMGNHLRKVDQWLIDNARAEAEARGIPFYVDEKPGNWSQADKNLAEAILFDKAGLEAMQPKRSILKPLNPNDRQPGVPSEVTAADVTPEPATAGTEASDRFPFPAPTAYGDSKGKAPLARALKAGAAASANEDDRTAMQMGAAALTRTDWATYGGPEAQGGQLAELGDDVLAKAGSTREDLDNRVQAIRDLAEDLNRRGFGGIKVARSGDQEPTLAEYLTRYADGYDAARHPETEPAPAAAVEDAHAAVEDAPTVDAPAVVDAGEEAAHAAEAAPSVDGPQTMVNGAQRLDGMDLPVDSATGQYTPEQINHLAADGEMVLANIGGKWQPGHFLRTQPSDEGRYRFLPAGSIEERNADLLSPEELHNVRAMSRAEIPGDLTDAADLRPGTLVTGHNGRKQVTGLFEGVSPKGNALVRDDNGDVHQIPNGGQVRPILGAYAPGNEPTEATFAPTSGVWETHGDGLAVGVPGEYAAGIRPDGHGGYDWSINGVTGGHLGNHEGNAPTVSAAKAAIEDALYLAATRETAPASISALPGDDAAQRDAKKAELNDVLAEHAGTLNRHNEDVPSAEAESEKPAAEPAPVVGKPAGWVPTGDLEPGNVARVDGDNGNGEATTRTGHVLGTPEPVEVHQPGKKPRKGTRTVVGDNPDGTGDREVVLSPAESVAARAERDEEKVGDNPQPRSATEAQVMAGDVGDRLPVDAHGVGVYPGSTVSDRNGRSGVVTETSDMDVAVKWAGDKHEKRMRPGLLTVDEQNRPDGWTKDGRMLHLGSLVATEDNRFGTVTAISGDTVTVDGIDGEHTHSAGDLKVVGVKQDAEGNTVLDPEFDAPMTPEGIDVRPLNPTKPEPLPEGVPSGKVFLRPEHQQVFDALGLDTDQTSTFDVQQAALRVRMGEPITAAQAAALSAWLQEQVDGGGLTSAKARALKKLINRIGSTGRRLQGNDEAPAAAEPETTDGPTLRRVDSFAAGDVIALPNEATGSVEWGTIRAFRPATNDSTGEVTPGATDVLLELPDGTQVRRTLADDAEVYSLPSLPEDDSQVAFEAHGTGSPVEQDRAYTEPRIADRLHDAAEIAVDSALGGDDAKSPEELAQRIEAAADDTSDARDQHNASRRLGTALEESGVDPDSADHAHAAADAEAEFVAEYVREQMRNTAEDAEPLPGESNKDAVERLRDLLREAADGVDYDAAAERAINRAEAMADDVDTSMPTAGEQNVARRDIADALRADIFAMADQLAQLGNVEDANALSMVAARLAGHPDPVNVERAVQAAAMGREPSAVKSLTARIKAMFGRQRARFLAAVRGLLGNGRKVNRSLKAAVHAARAAWTHDDRDVDSLVKDAVAHLATGGDRDGGGIQGPDEPVAYADRVAHWMGQLPEDSEMFGRRPGRKSFGRLTPDALRSGRTVTATDDPSGARLDRAVDGGPGVTALGHSRAVHGLGRAHMDEVAARVRALHPDLGDDPAATVREAKRYAESMSADHRGDIDATELARLREKALADYEDKRDRFVAARRTALVDVLSGQRQMGPAGAATLNVQGRSDDAEEVRALRWAEQFLPTDWIASAGTIEAQAGRMSKYDDATITVAPMDDSPLDGGKYGASALHGLARHLEQAVPSIAAAEWAYHWDRTSSGAVGERKRRGKNSLGYLRDLFPALGLDKTRAVRAGDYSSPWAGEEAEDAPQWLLALSWDSLFNGTDYADDDTLAYITGIMGYFGRNG